MGPQVRMAASLSINKRKTYAADTSARGRGVPAPKPARLALRTAVALTERVAAGTFTVLPDERPMDLSSRRMNGARRNAANRL
jgi:hypothetical protein